MSNVVKTRVDAWPWYAGVVDIGQSWVRQGGQLARLQDVLDDLGADSSGEFTTIDIGATTISEVSEGVLAADGVNLALDRFVQSGTGAVTRTLQAKARDIVSVKDFGAVGDGVTNDTAAIDAWLTHVLSNGGLGVVPAGTYSMSSGVTAVLSASARIIVDSGAKFVAASGFPAAQRIILITTGTGSNHVFSWQGGQFDGTQITGDIFSFNAENCARCKIVLDRTTAGADWLNSGSDSHLFIGGAKNVHAEIGHALGAKDAGIYVSSSNDGTIGQSLFLAGNYEKCSVGVIVKRQFDNWTVDINAIDCLNGAAGGSATNDVGALVPPGNGALVRVNALRCERAVTMQCVTGALIMVNAYQIGASITGYTSTAANAVYLSGSNNCQVHANVSGVNPACTKTSSFRAVYCDRRTLDSTDYDATDNVIYLNANDVGVGFAEQDSNAARNVVHLKERTVTTASVVTGTNSFIILMDAETSGFYLKRAGSSLRAINSSDSALNTAFRFESDRATPSANDRLIGQWLLSDSAGNQTEFGREEVRAGTVTDGAEEGQWRWHVMRAGTLTDSLLLTSAQFRPTTSDGLSLGSTSGMWADLFLASGGVINWNNGNATITHSSGNLTTNVPLTFPSYTVAGLPTGAAGRTAFASNGRKNGEGAGAGTGVLVFHDGTAWRACDTGATVAA